MSHKSLRTWCLVAAVGLVAAACSDEKLGEAPIVPSAPQFALGTDITAPGTTTTINDALWTSAFALGVGTGLIDPFLSVQASPNEEGFNTDASPLPLNTTRPQFTDALPLNLVPVISEAGGTWREFILDANESNSNPDAQFSIDLFDMYVCNDANAPNYATVSAFASNANCTKIYNITGHAALRATDAATSGSGSNVDYRILIPSANFGTAANTACPYNPTGTACGYYVVLHVKMGFEGGDWATGATFEEVSTVRRPALTIVKTPDGQTVNAGNNITFTMVVTNTGGGTATSVTLNDNLPAGTGIDWSTATSGCTIVGSPPNETLSCSFGDIAEGASRTVTVTSATTGGSCGVYNNTATFNSTNAGTGSDAGQITVANCNGTVTVVKNTIGANGTFGFTAGGAPLTNFSLTTVSNTATTGQISVPVGTYTVAENALTADWEFVSVVCTGNGSGGTTSSTSSQTATLVVGLSANVVCTFTNRKKGTITIVKNTVGGNGSFSFTDDIPGGPASPFTITTTGGPPGTGQQQFTNVSAGTYTVTEGAVPTGWEFVNVVCTGNGAGGGTSGQAATIDLVAGGNVTCTFTNRKQVRLTIVKNVTTGSNTSTLFTFTPTGGWNGGATFQLAHGGTRTSAFLTPGTYGATETVPSGWQLQAPRVCVLTAGPGSLGTVTNVGSSVSVALAAGQEVTCTFVNDELGTLVVQKEIPGTGNVTLFSFTRATMPGGVPGSFTLGDGQSSSTGKTLTSGNYQVCETVPAGWLDPTASINGGADTPGTFDGIDTFCWNNIAVAKGGTTTIVVTNSLPPGHTRTIGYWRNWSSCTNGNQYEKALANGTWDKTLDGNLPQTVGLLTLAGAAGPNQASPDCDEAVNILSKRDLGGSNQASDAAYNLAAQFLAALLNVSAQAGSCTAADNAMSAAQTLLANLGFNGTGSYLPSGKNADATLRGQANTLAGTLGSYNEGTLGGGCPTHAN